MISLQSDPTLLTTDWELLGVYDMCPEPDDGYATCELCGHPRVRYLHEMEHPNWCGPLMVGCECAARLLGDHETPARLQRKLTNRGRRRKASPH